MTGIGATSARRKVGLLGGSFNPAHEGHLYISRQALDRLGLDEVWWMVSPQNPLKSETGMAPLIERMVRAKAATKDDARIVVTDVETKLNTRYTVDTLVALQAKFPDLAFVWIIGADNLRQMPRWKGWREIFRRVPIAVFPRAPYSLRALNGRAARRFDTARIPTTKASQLAEMPPPAWVFLRVPQHGQSATRIRKQHGVS